MPSESVPDIPSRIKTGLISGIQTSGRIIRIVLPLYIAVDLLKGTEVVNALGRLFAPAMTPFGLPGEAALAFVAACLLNLSSALAILAPLNLSDWQITQCGLMMGIAHSLPVEGGVIASTGSPGWGLTFARLIIAAGAGLLLNATRLLSGG